MYIHVFDNSMTVLTDWLHGLAMGCFVSIVEKMYYEEFWRYIQFYDVLFIINVFWSVQELGYQ